MHTRYPDTFVASASAGPAPYQTPPEAKLTALVDLARRVEELTVRFEAVNNRLTGLVLRLVGGEHKPLDGTPAIIEPDGLIARLNLDVDALLNAEDIMVGLVGALEDLA